jgi:hypothetical protein
MPEIGVDIAQKSVGRDFVDSNQGLRPRLAESRAEPMVRHGCYVQPETSTCGNRATYHS